jgi:uncharacterized protein
MLPLRLVLDTNIIVSAVLKPSSIPRTTLIIALTKPAHFYVSQPILGEYAEVLGRRELGIRPGARNQLLQLIRNRSRVVTPVRRISAASDPDDNIFLECADAARADFLITGNPRHFPSYWKQTKVITANEFVSLAAPHLLG